MSAGLQAQREARETFKSLLDNFINTSSFWIGADGEVIERYRRAAYAYFKGVYVFESLLAGGKDTHYFVIHEDWLRELQHGCPRKKAQQLRELFDLSPSQRAAHPVSRLSYLVDVL